MSTEGIQPTRFRARHQVVIDHGAASDNRKPRQSVGCHLQYPFLTAYLPAHAPVRRRRAATGGRRMKLQNALIGLGGVAGRGLPSKVCCGACLRALRPWPRVARAGRRARRPPRAGPPRRRGSTSTPQCVVQLMRDAADARSEHRHAVRHRFEHDEREGVGKRREDEEIGPRAARRRPRRRSGARSRRSAGRDGSRERSAS